MPSSIRRPLNKKRKKAGALPGGTSNKAKAQYKSLKGERFPRKKPDFLAKKKFLKFVYAGNFGNALSSVAECVDFFLGYKNRNQPEAVRAMGNAEESLNEIEIHYRRVKNLPEQYKKDPDFRPVIFWLKKQPELKRLFSQFKINPSQKTANQIGNLVREIRDQGDKFAKVAMKYGVLREIHKDRRIRLQ